MKGELKVQRHIEPAGRWFLKWPDSALDEEIMRREPKGAQPEGKGAPTRGPLFFLESGLSFLTTGT
ncbi:MAG TPA: hypothetical protein DCR87_07545 [Acidobacteria bacterium]|nr:hypothetical protein [Acidobacteriota bacterium]